MNLDNPPAFPTRATGKSLNDGSWMADVIAGMTLRDYFAGQALIGFISVGRSIDLNTPTGLKTNMPLQTACYVMADALLAERMRQ